MKATNTIALASLVAMTMGAAPQLAQPAAKAQATVSRKAIVQQDGNVVLRRAAAQERSVAGARVRELPVTGSAERQVYGPVKPKSLEECTAENPCPPNIKFIGPTSVTTYMEGRYDKFKIDVGECDRFTANKEYCLYPEDKLEIGLPKLTAAQRNAGYTLSLWSKDPRVRAAVKDHVITHDEVKDPLFTAEKLFVVLRGPDKALCASYGLDLTLLACERPEAPPVAPAAPAPYCGDGIINQIGEQCDGTAGLKPGQICTPDCKIECPECPPAVPPAMPPAAPPAPPVAPTPVALPPRIDVTPEKHWSLTALVDRTNMDVKTIVPNESKYCEAPCDVINIFQEFEGPSVALEAAYKRPDLSVAITAFMKELEQQGFRPERFQQYFADEIETQGLKLEVTKSLSDLLVKPFVNIDASVTQNDTSRAGATQAFDPMSVGIYVGPMVGELDKSHLGVGAGYEVHDEFYRTFAPDFRTSDPATVRFQNPAAKAFGQLTLENPLTVFGRENSFDLFGSYKHHFGEESRDVEGAELDLQREWEVGGDWMIGAGRIDIGPQIRYGETKRELRLPEFNQEMDSKSIYGGIKIRF